MRKFPPLLIGMSLMACTAKLTGPEVETADDAIAAALIPLADCGEAEAYLRRKAALAVERAYAEAFQYVLTHGDSTNDCARYDAGMPVAAAESTGSTKATNASGTNNQVQGVDEADFIKNDGRYIYVANHGALRIYDAFPATNAHLVGKLAIEGEAVKLLLDGDRALVYSKRTSTSAQAGGSGERYYGGECTYGYECTPSGDGTQTALTVVDIANKAAPAQVREIVQSGSLLSARQIGHQTYTVTTEAAGTLTWQRPSYGSCSGKSQAELLQRLSDDLRLARTQVQRAAIRMPTATDTAFTVDASQMCAGMYRSPLGDASRALNVLALDLDPAHAAPLKNATILSNPGHVYASAGSLYVAVPRTRQSGQSWYAGRDESVLSDIHKFNISGASSQVAYTASGLVKGGVLNQFAMDENNGNLRVATSYGRVPSKDVHSTMTVLDQVGNALVPIGIVDRIAPNEDIRSVRFDGDRGYIVTFKKTDPLYVFDLANARAPRILGELKIPGFSTYMHMLDPTHLLTIGYDANDHGDFAYFDGVILQIFDVSNPAAPTLAAKHKIGTRGSSSEALTNHLAFNYFAPLNSLAIPMTVCEGGGDGSYGTNMTFSGLMVFGVNASSGFSETGRIAHPQTASGGYNSGGCGNWWTNASSLVKRSIFMDNWVYSVSDKEIRIADINNLSAPTAILNLTQ